jgi:hypothetical protein
VLLNYTERNFQKLSTAYKKGETYAVFFDSDTLLVLALKGIAEESDCKIHRRCEHAVPVNSSVCNIVVWKEGKTYCDSVRKTGIVFDWVKFCN